jgi:hypothetical protein
VLKSIDATAALLVLQIPPGIALVSKVDDPLQTLAVPPIADGDALTVIVVVLKHPVGKVYVIVEVPAAIEVTTPVPEITATLASLLLHVPPTLASNNVVVRPVHTVVVPVITAGVGLTVTTCVLVQPVPNV